MDMLRIIILGSVIGLSACTGSDKKTDASETDTLSTMKLATDSNGITAAIDTTNSQNGPAWKGTYEGILPCEDCAGKVIKIVLNSDSSYIATTKHLRPKENKEDSWNGKFTWINASTIQLEAVREIAPKYLLAENKMIQLDVDGKEHQGEMAHKYILKKTDLKK
ncbi:MAG: copper resistance protein NlpE N-terminal domain-containing protein [Ferruginibacter sp.]